MNFTNMLNEIRLTENTYYIIPFLHSSKIPCSVCGVRTKGSGYPWRGMWWEGSSSGPLHAGSVLFLDLGCWCGYTHVHIVKIHWIVHLYVLFISILCFGKKFLKTSHQMRKNISNSYYSLKAHLYVNSIFICK